MTTSGDSCGADADAACHDAGEADRMGSAANGTETVRLSVPEMDCPSCADKVGAALDGVAGVTAHDTRPATGTVVVTYDDATEADVVAAIENAGYEVAETDTEAGDTGMTLGVTGNAMRLARVTPEADQSSD